MGSTETTLLAQFVLLLRDIAVGRSNIQPLCVVVICVRVEQCCCCFLRQEGQVVRIPLVEFSSDTMMRGEWSKYGAPRPTLLVTTYIHDRLWLSPLFLLAFLPRKGCRGIC